MIRRGRVGLISEKFADELSDKEMRDLFRAAQTRTKVVSQIRAIRKQRGWSQAEFARQLGKPQSNVSQRLENREYGGFTLATLLDVAATFDVGLVVEFVPYDEFIRRTTDLTDSTQEVPGFDRNALTALRNEADSASGASCDEAIDDSMASDVTVAATRRPSRAI